MHHSNDNILASEIFGHTALRSHDPCYRNTIKILPGLLRGDYDEGDIGRRYLKYNGNKVKSKSKGILRSRLRVTRSSGVHIVRENRPVIARKLRPIRRTGISQSTVIPGRIPAVPDA